MKQFVHNKEQKEQGRRCKRENYLTNGNKCSAIISITIICITMRAVEDDERRVTMFVDEQDQVSPIERSDVEQQSRTLCSSEAQGDVFSSQHHVRVDG